MLQLPRTLLHLIYRDFDSSLQSEGIQSSKDMVFLTDDLKFSVSYYRCKDLGFSTPGLHVVARADSKSMLRDGFTIFAIDRPNAFVPSSIPSRHIADLLLRNWMFSTG